jgi:hypothetical protein
MKWRIIIILLAVGVISVILGVVISHTQGKIGPDGRYIMASGLSVNFNDGRLVVHDGVMSDREYNYGIEIREGRQYIVLCPVKGGDTLSYPFTYDLENKAVRIGAQEYHK